MTNQNGLSPKYLSQLQSNTIQVEAMSAELDEIKKELDIIRQIMEKAEKRDGVLSLVKDTLNQHEAKLNQLSFSVKELANRFSAFRNSKQKD